MKKSLSSGARIAMALSLLGVGLAGCQAVESKTPVASSARALQAGDPCVSDGQCEGGSDPCGLKCLQAKCAFPGPSRQCGGLCDPVEKRFTALTCDGAGTCANEAPRQCIVGCTADGCTPPNCSTDAQCKFGDDDCAGRCVRDVCVFPGVATSCGQGGVVADGYQQLGACDGQGGCSAGELNKDCGSACGQLVSCASDAECDRNQTCRDGVCKCGGAVALGGGGCSTASGGSTGALALPLVALGVWFALRGRRWQRRGALALAALISVTATNARAAQSFELQRFQALYGARDILGVESALTPGHLSWGVGALGNYAHNPFVLVIDDRAGNLETQSVVASQYALDVGGTLGLGQRFEISVSLPMTVSTGEGGGAGVLSNVGAPERAAISAIRVAPKARLFSAGDFHFALAVPVSIPISGGDFLMDNSPAVNPRLLIEFAPGFRLVGNIGYLWREATDYFLDSDQGSFHLLTVGQAVNYGLGAEIPLWKDRSRLDLLATAFGETGLEESREWENPVEALGALRWTGASGLSLMAGGGAGLTRGYGAPEFRVLAGLGYVTPPSEKAPVEKPVEKPEPAAAKPAVPKAPALRVAPLEVEVQQGFSVRVDPLRQVSGADIKDLRLVSVTPGAIGQTLALPEGDVRYSANTDKSGVDEFNYVVADRENNQVTGTVRVNVIPAPKDTDRDGIPDDVDKCPTKPETYNNFQDEDGCPDVAPKKTPKPAEAAKVVGKKIVIMDQVYFATAKDTILPKSYPVLDSVARVLLENPQITRLRIEGHTDSVGNAAKNLDLSDRRAKMVLGYLVKSGVDAERLEAQGFGPTQPIDTNKTAKGRANNRRVEFNIMETTGR